MWAELAEHKGTSQMSLLSEFLNTCGASNQFQKLDLSSDFCMQKIEDARSLHIESKSKEEITEDFDFLLKWAMSEFDSIRIGSPFNERVTYSLPEVPAEILTYRSADLLVKENNKWWPRSLMKESLVRQIGLRQEISIMEPVLIVGASDHSRAVIAALIHAGFSRVNVTDRFNERGEHLVSQLQKQFFSVKFDYTPQVSLTTLPGIYSLVVNAALEIDETELISDLSYFNFLSPKGVVMDLDISRQDTQLISAARQVEATVIEGLDLCVDRDLLWVEKVWPGLKLDRAHYFQFLKSKL
jgi:shikimate 5-dehydrogenase